MSDYILSADLLQARAVEASRTYEVDWPRKSIYEVGFLYRSSPTP